MKDLGLRLNAKKSVLPAVQWTTYLGVMWDLTMMQGRLSPARIESILAIVKREREGLSLTVKLFQKLLSRHHFGVTRSGSRAGALGQELSHCLGQLLCGCEALIKALYCRTN